VFREEGGDGFQSGDESGRVGVRADRARPSAV
jgi:hypothetical protein